MTAADGAGQLWTGRRRNCQRIPHCDRDRGLSHSHGGESTIIIIGVTVFKVPEHWMSELWLGPGFRGH